MLYCVITHLLNKRGRLLVMFYGPLLICMFHRVLAVETVWVVTRKESQKSRTNCENVLCENAKLWNKLRLSPHDSNLRCEYRESVHLWRELLRANEIVHEQHIVDANNLGAFYRFVKTRISNGSTVGAIVDEGLILTDNQDKANAFDKYFCSVGVANNGSIPHCRDLQ